MCINCDLYSMLNDKEGDLLFPDILGMHVMHSVNVVKRIKEATEKEFLKETPLFYCSPALFRDFSRLRVMNLKMPEGFKNAGIKDSKGDLVSVEYFTGLTDIDFHLTTDSITEQCEDIEDRKQLIRLGRLMTCNMQNIAGRDPFLQGCIVPDDGVALIREVKTFIDGNKNKFTGLYRLIKSRFGADSLLFMRCLVQELDDYIIRSVNNIDWLKIVIKDIAVKGQENEVTEDLDDQMKEYSESPAYHTTRAYLKHTHGEKGIPDPFATMSTVKS